VARRVVAAALPEPAQSELRDMAKLLVSELVTNSVVHAASGVELEVEADNDPETGYRVTVRVRDADTGPLVMRAGGGTELDEGGRGLLLVDRLAQAWGTEHHAGRKTVWFRLAGNGDAPWPSTRGTPAPAAEVPSSATPEAQQQRLSRLLLPAGIASALTFDEHVGELLMRVLDAVGADGAVVALMVGEGSTVVRGEPGGPAVASVELVVEDRVLGTIDVHGSRPLDPDEAAYVALAADRIALLVAEHGLLEAEGARSSELDFVTEATDLLTRSLSVSLNLALVTQLVVPRLGDWCAAYSVDDRGRPRRLTVNHRNEDRTDAVLSVLETDNELRQVIREVAAGGPAVRLPSTVPVAGQRSHVTVLALRSRDRTHGVLVTGRAQPLDPVAYMAALELARRAALAVDNARLHEEQLSTVNALQASLLPTALPTLPGVQLAARYHSASTGLAVGGDFYDAYTLPSGKFALAIGDVCGKGAEAATVTGMTRDLLRVLLQDGASPATALHRLNRALIDHPTATRFCTVALATAERVDGQLRVRLCLAGHPEPVLLHRDGSTELVGTPGDLLGVLPDDEMSLAEVDLVLAAGESLVLFTDGVTERRDETKMFGQYGVRHSLDAIGGADAQVVADTLDEAARSFVANELRDDVAILVVRNDPSGD
jgi:serine phosphatase RsbU (regulator of sigma subunit)/anti-sigma regulatory factor (Ser/Thr protein kinase)